MDLCILQYARMITPRGAFQWLNAWANMHLRRSGSFLRFSAHVAGICTYFQKGSKNHSGAQLWDSRVQIMASQGDSTTALHRPQNQETNALTIVQLPSYNGDILIPSLERNRRHPLTTHLVRLTPRHLSSYPSCTSDLTTSIAQSGRIQRVEDSLILFLAARVFLPLFRSVSLETILETATLSAVLSKRLEAPAAVPRLSKATTPEASLPASAHGNPFSGMDAGR